MARIYDNSKSPILNNPYEEPRLYYDTDMDGNLDYSHVIDGRRPFTTSIDIVPKHHEQMQMFGGSDFENTDPNAAFINEIREQVKKWRENNYAGVTRVTRELLNYWFKNPERQWHLQLFYCQREAIETAHVEIQGMDMYDPIQDRVAERNIADIAYWELDDHYSGTEFRVRSIHFCGGDKKEFAAWKKGLESVAPKKAKKNVERTLRMEFPDDVWDSLYDFRSAPIKYEHGRQLAVRVVSQFGEESTKVITME
ncbi:MAG: hypothetical protein K5896_04500 [Prevotella sp.]|nr:hypothetical protein [Prevotella sp.]